MEWIKGAGLLLVHGRWERNCELRRQAHRSITDSQVEDGGFEICIGDEAAMDDELGRSMEGDEAARIFFESKGAKDILVRFSLSPFPFLNCSASTPLYGQHEVVGMGRAAGKHEVSVSGGAGDWWDNMRRWASSQPWKMASARLGRGGAAGYMGLWFVSNTHDELPETFLTIYHNLHI